MNIKILPFIKTFTHPIYGYFGSNRNFLWGLNIF